MTKAIEVKKAYDLTSPQQMTGLAKVLKQYVVDNKLYTGIQGKNYVHVEGWQFAGGMLGLMPRIVKVEQLNEKGSKAKWMAEAEIFNVKTGLVVGKGFAICSSEEGKKKSFDEYAILSMAQTRAVGKAYRNLIGWTMKLAGYQGTPAEEMTARGEQPTGDATSDEDADRNPDLLCNKSGCGKELTKQEYDYSKKLYGVPLCREHQKGAKRK